MTHPKPQNDFYTQGKADPLAPALTHTVCRSQLMLQVQELFYGAAMQPKRNMLSPLT